jgi:hypothetical protein
MRPAPERSQRWRPVLGSSLSEKLPCAPQGRQRIVGQLRRAGFLGELSPGPVDGNRMMQISRRRESELTLQPDLPRRRGEQVGAADHIGAALQRIVDDDGELVSEQAVGALDDEIADIAIETLLLSALEAIGECNRRIVDRDPPRASFSACGAAMPARARIDALAARSGWRRFKLAPRADAGKQQASLAQTVERLLVDLATLALPRTGRPDGTVRRQRGRDRLAHRRVGAASRVLYAQQPFAALRARIAITRERGDQRAEVERAGR